MSVSAQALLNQPAPDFTLNAVQPGGAWQPVTLSSYAAAGRAAVLVFYPLDFSPACTAQVPDYSRRAAEFDAAGADVLCISRDSVYTHRAWSRELRLQVPLLADLTLAVAAQYGVAAPEQGCARRAVFVVGRDGRVHWLHLEEDPAAVTLSAAEVLQHVPGPAGR
ncbi:redoxin domain-containing protein [Deinococcus sp. Marseille-Q6407]|uniref:redoxin domain-containing protein n=1 Tax=Deinococcus sp. Marseille-Q6407 TaxID=2969223 RepID=UPI0021BECFCE|nr:redoxin domain-containing protein [Deinococcus sp. Marseille-Q6407]